MSLQSASDATGATSTRPKYRWLRAMVLPLTRCQRAAQARQPRTGMVNHIAPSASHEPVPFILKVLLAELLTDEVVARDVLDQSVILAYHPLRPPQLVDPIGAAARTVNTLPALGQRQSRHPDPDA